MSSEKLSISIAGIADAEIITQLSKVTFLETFEKDNAKADMDKYLAEEMNLERLTEELRDPGNRFLLAWYEDTPVGYAKLRSTKIPAELAGTNPMEIERIYVLRDYHGKKAGATLMAHSIAHATEQGHDMVWLGVWEHNHKALNFYKQWGFELFGDHHFLLGDDLQTDVLMKKALR